MYLRMVLKLDKVYAANLNCEDYVMPEKAAGLDIDVKHLNNFLRRLTRLYLLRPASGRADSFCVLPAGYSYKDGKLYLVSRRRGVLLPKDGKTSTRQIRVRIKEDYAVITIPAEVKKKKHEDFQNIICVHVGYQSMCTLSSGKIYG